MIIHVYPNNEEHELEGTQCICEPKLEILKTGDMILSHNSFDGREAIEMANELIK